MISIDSERGRFFFEVISSATVPIAHRPQITANLHLEVTHDGSRTFNLFLLPDFDVLSFGRRLRDRAALR